MALTSGRWLRNNAKWLASGIILLIAAGSELFLLLNSEVRGVFVGIGHHLPPTSAWQSIHDRQPNEVTLKLSFPENHFYQGEIITAGLTFTNTTSKKYGVITTTVDRAGRVCDIQFAACDDKGTFLPDAMGWYQSSQSEGGPIGGNGIGQSTVTITANQWLRFDHPGRYTVTAWTQRCYFQNETCFELVSNPVVITIDPLPADNEKDIIADAHLKIITARNSPTEENQEIASTADTVLCYLQTPKARSEIRYWLGQSPPFGSDMGLMIAPDPIKEADLLLADARSGRIKINEEIVELYSALKGYPSAFRVHQAWEALYPREVIPADFYSRNIAPIEAENSKAISVAREEILAVAKQMAFKNGRIDPDYIWIAFMSHHGRDPATRADAVLHQLELQPDHQLQIVGMLKISNELGKNPGDDNFLPLIRKFAAAPYNNSDARDALQKLRPNEAAVLPPIPK